MTDRTRARERERPFDHDVRFEPDRDSDPNRVLFSAIGDVLPPPAPVEQPTGVFTAAEVPRPPVTCGPPIHMWMAQEDPAQRGHRVGWVVAIAAVAVLAGGWVVVAQRGHDKIDGRVAVEGLNESRSVAEQNVTVRAAAASSGSPTDGWITFDVVDQAATVRLPGTRERPADDPAAPPNADPAISTVAFTSAGMDIQLSTRPVPADAPAAIGQVTASEIASWSMSATATSVRPGPTVGGVATLDAELGGDPQGQARCAISTNRIVCLSVRWAASSSDQPAVIDIRRRILDSFTPRP